MKNSHSTEIRPNTESQQPTQVPSKTNRRLRDRFSSVDYWKTTWWIHLRGVIAGTNKTRNAFASELGISEQRLCHLINKDSDPRMSTVIRIASASGYAPHLVLEPIEDLVKRSVVGGRQYFDYKSNLVAGNNDISFHIKEIGMTFESGPDPIDQKKPAIKATIATRETVIRIPQPLQQ